MYCRNCGKEISEESTYCLYCGVRQKENYCRNCGKEIPNEAAFCPHCGLKQREHIGFISLIKQIISFFKIKEKEEENDPNNIKPLRFDEIKDKDNEIELFHNSDEIDNNREFKDESLKQSEDKPSENYMSCNEEKDTYDNKKELSGDDSKPLENIVDTSNHDTDIEIIYNYDRMPLLQRFCGSVIDKFIIILLFVLVNISIDPYKSAGDLGIYRAMLGTTPANYEYIDRENINESNGISNLYGDTPYIGQTRAFDMKMTTIFFVVYLLYYFIFEITIHSSPGKKLLEGILRTTTGEKMDETGAYFRIIVRGFLILFIIGALHFELGLSHYITIAMFLFFVDIPVFFTHRSLIDLLTGSMYMEKGEPIIQSEQDEIINKPNTFPELQYINEENNKEEYNDEKKEFVDENVPSKTKWYILIVFGILCLGAFSLWYFLLSSSNGNKVCPELIEAANQINSKVPFILVDGMEIVNVAYEDSTYTTSYQIDNESIPFEKIGAFQKEHKQSALAIVQNSKGKESENYHKFVEYHVTKIDKYINKQTGESVSIIISPEEIEEALKEPLSDLAKLEQTINMQRKMLPSEIDEGFVLKEIEITGEKVIMSVSVDEDIYDMDKVKELKDDLKTNIVRQFLTDPAQRRFCQQLAAANCGLIYRYYGNQSFLETNIDFSSGDIKKMTLSQ